jgi:2-polyprenyl-3-methyl-5-hydroxy-6-metoxy-1,4-benzoquinol methylase
VPLVQTSQHYTRGGQQKDVYGPDEVTVVVCPLCERDEPEFIYTEHGAVRVVRCTNCGLLYVSPRVKAPAEIYWGPADVYVEEARDVFTGARSHHRDPNYLEELELIRRYRPSGRFLDVGCNMGFLLNKARSMGWDVTGVEPSPSLSGVAREQWRLPVVTGLLSDLPADFNHTFDVVALSDVFEHVTTPKSLLADVARVMKPDGVLYVKVPNGAWNLFKQRVLSLAGQRPSQGVWDSYEHVVHYTERTLRAMLAAGGFRVQSLTIGKPIQTPVWHLRLGHYYQYPSPWAHDWRRKTIRSACYWGSRVERVIRGGRVGALAPNLAAIARLA